MRKKLAALAIVFALALGAEAAQACRFHRLPPDNAPRAELYRNPDRALIVATVVRGGTPAEALLRVDQVIYGRVARGPLTLGWSGDPQYSYRYETELHDDEGNIIILGCGQYTPFLTDIATGQRVIVRLGVTREGAQVTVRWQPLEEAGHDARVAAFLAAADRRQRRKAGRTLRDYPLRNDVVVVSPEAR